MPSVLALADDLTGALEVGAKFASAQIPSLVRVYRAEQRENTGDNAVTVLDTETRHCSPERAAAVVSSVDTSGASLIYQKTDSTLRGNIAAELGALAERHADWRIAYLPAYPALGRTVKNGVLYVHGVPVHETSFAKDVLNPVRHSSVAAVLEGLACKVYEGEFDHDVRESVGAALADGYRIIAGPACVAEAIAACLFPSDRSSEPPQWPRVSTCLIVNGSLHEMSARQVRHAESAGCASDRPVTSWQILSPAISAESPLERAIETGQYVQSFLASGHFDALMVFGGDTAYGILAAMGCPSLEPLGEVVPGVPVARAQGRNVYLITKAGGFGDEDLICQVKSILHTADSSPTLRQ